MIYFILAIIYNISKEMEEASFQNTYPANWGSWWNNETSWPNKHRWGKALASRIGFAKSFIKLSMRTWLVFITDAEHFFQMVRMLAMAGVVYYAGGLTVLLLFLGGYYLGGSIKETLKAFGINIIK